jgi:hypothetical protein
VPNNADFTIEGGQVVFHDSTKDFDLRHDYQSHYNARLNKCFFCCPLALAQPLNFITLELYDVNENASYGMYNSLLSENAQTYCAASGRRCSSQDEWADLVRPYMND